MRIQLYQIDNGAITFIGNISQYTKIDRTESYYGVGSFTVTFPLLSNFTQLQKDRLLRIVDGNSDFWGIIRKIVITEGTDNSITVSGSCIKSLFARRVTSVNATDNDVLLGYDQIAGTTEACMRHYIINNVTSPTYAVRRIPFITLEAAGTRGIAADKYYSRYENLADVLEKLGKRGDIGWQLVRTENGFEYRTLSGRDRTQEQPVLAPVVLRVGRGIQSSEIIEDSTSAKNTYYATKTGYEFEDEALTQTYYNGGSIISGYDRCETAFSVGIDSTEDTYAGMQEQAMKKAEDYAGIATYNITLPPDSDILLGDRVTLALCGGRLIINRRLTEITKSVSAGSTTVSGIFGDKNLTKFETLNRENRRF